MRFLLPLCRGVSAGTFYLDFHEGVTEALREVGHEPVVFPFAAVGEKTEEEMQALYRQLSSNRIGAVLDLCCWGYGLSQVAVENARGEQTPIFDAHDVPYVAMLYDHPHFQAIDAIRARRLYATFPDLGHPEQARLVHPGLERHGEVFAPPAVRPANDRSVPDWSDRDIDVLYVGNLEVDALERFWRGGPNAGLCDAVADEAFAQPERSLHRSVAAAIAQYGPIRPGFDFNAIMRAVEFFLRATFRRDAVAALARSGVRMRVVGRGCGALDLPPNVDRVAETDYEGFFRLAGQARICLDASTYLDGANDCVFSHGLNRAVCFTDTAGYLKGSSGDHGGLRFYSMRRLDAFAGAVRALLARTGELPDAGERARQSVLASHTWRHRLSDILAALRS